MIVNFSDTSFENKSREFYIEMKGIKNFPIMHIGRRSYIVSSSIECFEPEIINVCIGNYCSIAHNVSFLLNLDHDYL